MLFNEGTDSTRINILTKCTIATHLVLQGNATFRSSVYSPTLPLVPFSTNVVYVRTSCCPPNVIPVQIRQHLWRLSWYLINNPAISTLFFCISVKSFEYLLVFTGNPELWRPWEQTQCCECGRSVWPSARSNPVSVHFQSKISLPCSCLSSVRWSDPLMELFSHVSSCYCAKSW